MTRSIDEQLARLASDAHAYRARAVLLDARLRRFDHLGADLAELRRRLQTSAAQVEDAIAALREAAAKVA